MRKTGLALALLFARLLAAAQPWQPSDLWAWRTVSDPQISPDGGWVIYVEGRNDRDANAAFTNLWAVSSDGKRRVQVTKGAWRDRSPGWSPDSSRIAWIEEKNGVTELRAAILDPHAEVLIATAAVEHFAWSPDGKSIAFTARVARQAIPPSWAPAEVLPLLRSENRDRIQWFVAPSSGGKMRQLGDTDFDADGEPSWMPDSHSFVAGTAGGEIYSFDVAAGTSRLLFSDGRYDDNPMVSPDGARLAYRSRPREPLTYAVRDLRVINADGSRGRILGGSLDRDVLLPQWSSDSRTVYFIADDRGATHVYAARNDGSTRQVTRDAEVLSGFSLAANGRAASVRSAARRLEELVTFAVDVPSTAEALAAPNTTLLAERSSGTVEEITFPSGGAMIQGWLLKPPGFDAAKKYPLLLEIEDSRAMYGPAFSPRAHIYAAQGMVVLHINPRGAAGYGQAFGQLLPTRVPGDDADDLLRGVEFVSGLKYVDTRRLAVRGGLLAAWILGHSDRFAAAIAYRPVVDWTVNIATASDGVRRAAAFRSGFPWDDPDSYVRHSPIYFAKDFQTPTLVVAAGHDPEAAELYFALQARKVESALARIPDETPRSEIAELQAELAWLRRFLVQ